jgi:hypothetical protein
MQPPAVPQLQIENTAAMTDQARRHDFVLACLRCRLGAGSLPDMAALTADPALNPQSLIDYARSQRVAPLLHRALLSRAALPEEIAQALHQAYIDTARANLYLMHEFQQILQALTSRGLPVVVGKGPLLVEQVYRDPALRPFSDLDIFVRWEHVPAVMSCLRESGLQPVAEPYPGQALDFEKELLFTRPGIIPVNVDLHWVLFGPTYYHHHRVPQDWLWGLTGPAQAAGVPVQAWRLEVQILHLASHLLMDHTGGSDLLWWYDLAALFQENHPSLQWDLIVEYAQRLQLVLPLRECLQELSSGWGVAIPGETLSRLQSLQPSPQEIRAYRWRVLPRQVHVQRAWEALRALPGSRLRLRYLGMRLFPSPAYLRRILPGSLPTLLLYPAYWLRGIKMVISLLAKKNPH